MWHYVGADYFHDGERAEDEDAEEEEPDPNLVALLHQHGMVPPPEGPSPFAVVWPAAPPAPPPFPGVFTAAATNTDAGAALHDGTNCGEVGKEGERAWARAASVQPLPLGCVCRTARSREWRMHGSGCWACGLGTAHPRPIAK
jgi:hypothetical protein